MVDITDADYGHAKRVCKEFEIKNLEQYHDLCVQCSNEQICQTMYLRALDRNMCIKTYELDQAKYLSAPRLALLGL